LAECLKQTKLT